MSIRKCFSQTSVVVSILLLASVQPLAAATASEAERLEKLERAVEQLQKRNAELEAEVSSLKKQTAAVPEGKMKTKVTYDGKTYVEKAAALLKAVGLEGFGDRYPWQLSGGMQQRASLCRALIHEPALLLLDEPFGALDAFTREELWAVLRDLWAAQRFTVILVTHDLTEAVYLADKVHVCSKRPGRIVTTRNVDLPHPRDKYAPEFVALVRELHNGIAEVRAS